MCPVSCWLFVVCPVSLFPLFPVENTGVSLLALSVLSSQQEVGDETTDLSILGKAPAVLAGMTVDRPFAAYVGDEPYIFVSYAHEDSEVVYPEIQWLRGQGFNIWYDEGISPGSAWSDEVALALSQCAVFLYFISPRSVASKNCLNEVNFCLSRERTILSVHLEETALPMGVELSLSAMQAIIRGNHTTVLYQDKLVTALNSLLPRIPSPLAAATHSATATDRPSIAVLPLVNRSSDPQNEYLCDGLSEELINGLSSLKALRVASQLSSFRFKGGDLDPGAIGRQLRVAHILSGSIQKDGNRVRINVQLSQVENDSMLWSNRYSHELSDVFQLQEDVAREVINALKIELDADQDGKEIDVGTRDAGAYDLFLLALHEARPLTRQASERAIGLLKRAVELDPAFGRAHWVLADLYGQLKIYGLPPKEMDAKRRGAIGRARDSGFVPRVPWSADLDAHSSQRLQATKACEKIRNPDPQWPSYAYYQLADCLLAAGLFHAASRYYEYYHQHVNYDVGFSSVHIWLLTHLGRFDKSIELYTDRIAAQPDDPISLGDRALVYSRTGQYEKAEQDLEALKNVFPRSFPQFYYLYCRRELDAARAYFNWLEGRKNLPLWYKFWGCFLLGDIERGIDHVEAYVVTEPGAPMLRLNAVRVLPPSIQRQVVQHPRFQAVLEQLGTDDRWRDELLLMANGITDVTGIQVQQDDDYW